MNKLRLSYTLVKCWMCGHKDEAIQQYLHMDRYITPAMQRGLDFDKYATDFAEKNKRLPDELGGKKLTDPKGHYQIVYPYDNKLDLKVEFDLLDTDTIIEIKNSTCRDSAGFSDELQLSFYLLAAQLEGLKTKKAELYRYDPTKKQMDMTLVWNSRRRMEEAIKAIETYGPEIHEYFTQQGII